MVRGLFPESRGTQGPNPNDERRGGGAEGRRSGGAEACVVACAVRRRARCGACAARRHARCGGVRGGAGRTLFLVSHSERDSFRFQWQLSAEYSETMSAVMCTCSCTGRSDGLRPRRRGRRGGGGAVVVEGWGCSLVVGVVAGVSLGATPWSGTGLCDCPRLW